MKKLFKIVDEIAALKRLRDAEVAKLKCTRITWTLGRHLQNGVVADTSMDRLQVINNATGKTFWINLHRVVA